MEIKGKVVIVTGASSGIGEATARQFGREGAKVVLAARRVDRLESLAQEINVMGMARKRSSCRRISPGWKTFNLSSVKH